MAKPEFHSNRAITKRGEKLDVISRVVRLPNGKKIQLTERESQVWAAENHVGRTPGDILQRRMSDQIRAFAHLEGKTLPRDIHLISKDNVLVVRMKVRRKTRI